jgi:hypothetical protein
MAAMAAILDFCKKKLHVKYSLRGDENSHQMSFRSPKGFKSCIDVNILLKSKMAAMAAILDSSKILIM